MICCLCYRRPPELLALPYGLICPDCLADHLRKRPLDDAAAYLCAAIVENEM